MYDKSILLAKSLGITIFQSGSLIFLETPQNYCFKNGLHIAVRNSWLSIYEKLTEGIQLCPSGDYCDHCGMKFGISVKEYARVNKFNIVEPGIWSCSNMSTKELVRRYKEKSKLLNRYHSQLLKAPSEETRDLYFRASLLQSLFLSEITRRGVTHGLNSSQVQESIDGIFWHFK